MEAQGMEAQGMEAHEKFPLDWFTSFYGWLTLSRAWVRHCNCVISPPMMNPF
jgi:hypothetical protein